MDHEYLLTLVQQTIREHASDEVRAALDELNTRRRVDIATASAILQETEPFADDTPAPLAGGDGGQKPKPGPAVDTPVPGTPGAPPDDNAPQPPKDTGDGLDLPIDPPKLKPPPVADVGRGDPKAAAPLTCNCSFVSLFDPDEDENLDDGWTKGKVMTRRRWRRIEGANVDVGARSTGILSYDYTVVGLKDLIIQHANPCPDCDGKAVFSLYGRTAVLASVDGIAITGDASGQASIITDVSKDLVYRTEAAVVPAKKEKGALELEVTFEVPLPGGGTLDVKYKPQLINSENQHDENKNGARNSKVGNGATIRIWSKGQAEVKSTTGTVEAIASSKSVFAWYAYCDCPRHNGMRRDDGRSYAAKGDEEKGQKALDGLKGLATAAIPSKDALAMPKIAGTGLDCAMTIYVTAALANLSVPSGSDWSFEFYLQDSSTPVDLWSAKCDSHQRFDFTKAGKQIKLPKDFFAGGMPECKPKDVKCKVKITSSTVAANLEGEGTFNFTCPEAGEQIPLTITARDANYSVTLEFLGLSQCVKGH